MVAIVTSGGLGLDRSSGSVLGGLGLLGQASLGRAGDNVYVNAANGNLVVSSSDEMLFGTGEDAVLNSTYNSQGLFNDDNGDNWRSSASRTVTGLTGTYGAAGSTVTRTDTDGSRVVFTWNTADNAYTAKESGGTYDTLTLTGSAWTWTDGSTQAVETYDNANGGRILTSVDKNGEGLTFSYNASGLVSRVTTQTGEYTNFVYSGSNLVELDTFSYANTGSAGSSGSLVQSTRVRYGYNASNQLSSVTVDLSPSDNSISDGNTYVTNYGYDAHGNVTSITQSDGSSLQIGYTQVGGLYRVTSLIQAVSSGVSRTTTFSYDTTNRVTTVTDPTGQTTKLSYDTSGQLTQIDQAPAVTGGSDQVTQFTYDANGNVLTQTLPGGQTTTYAYDTNGNRTLTRDALGNTVTRTYNSANQLLTETRYTVPDPDGAGSGQPSGAETTYYAYDAHNNLRYVVSAQGDVTQYSYNASGQLVSTIQPTANAYNVSSLSPTSPPSAATLDAWFSGLTDLSQAERTDTTYDFRGNVASTTTYAQLTTAGAGITTSGVSKTVYVYDQAGRLLSQLQTDQTGSGTAQTYAYDGLGRLVSVTDPDHHTTSTVFNDASSQTVITNADGTTRTSVYDLTGALISSTHSAAPSPVTTTYKYDAQGNLRISTDPMGQSTYYLYDATGRKVAEVLPDGTLTEYAYDADNNLVSTIVYATKLTSTQLASLVDSSGNPTAVTLASIRPSAMAGDARSYAVYDNAGRPIETIDPSGAVVQYVYDGTSELVSTTAYANRLSSTTLSGLTGAPPTSLVLPTANASADRTTRAFYDADGREVATLDPDGYLTQTIYDAAGRKTQTIQYANAASSSLLASGTLSQLLTSVGTSATDIHQTFTYDGRGLLLTSTDGAGRTMSYTYDPVGRVATVTDGAGDVTHNSYDAVGNLISQTDARGVVTTYGYDAENRLTSKTVDPTGLNLISTIGYDALGRVVSTTDAAGVVTTTAYDADGRMTAVVVDAGSGKLNLTTTYAYDADGRVISKTDGAATAAPRTTTYAYDSLGRVVTTVVDAGSGHLNLTTTNTYDADGNLAAVTDPTGAVARTVYNAFGQPVYVIDPTGDVTQTTYDADGRATQVTQYANALSSTTLTGLGLTPTASALAAAISTSASDRTTTFTYDEAGRIGLAEQVAVAVVGVGRGEVEAPRAVYDTAGREAYGIDASGAVVAYAYDGDGNVVKTTQYATDYTASGNPTLSAMQSWATANTASGDRTSRALYDDAGRLAFSIDAQGEVTGYAYDADGRVTQRKQYAALYTGGDTTLAAMQAWATTNASSNDATTQSVYDAAGRVVDAYDAMGVRTHYAYDALGNVYNFTAAYGTASAETTVYTYDTAGRLASQVVDPGAGHLNLATTYQRDADGRVTQVTDPNGNVAVSAYDAAGRLVSSTVDPGTGHLSLTMSYQYDAFGDKVMVTDPNGNHTYFYYDNAGRQTLAVDPLGYATQTVYDADGNATQSTRYYTATTGAAVGAPPTITTNAKDATTNATYDALCRVLSTTDAEGHTVSYVLDAFGDQVQVTNQLGGVTTYAYDHMGRLTSSTQTITWTDSSNVAQSQVVTDTYAYDARGNRTQAVLASGAPEQQTITYAYDLDNRQTSQSELVYTGNAQTVPPGSATKLAIQSTQYDAFGNAVLTTDANGNQTYSYFDAANRKIAEVDVSNAVITTDANGNHTYSYFDPSNRSTAESGPLGTLTTWAYDGDGNVTSKIVYGTTVAPTSAGGAPPTAPSGSQRRTDYLYDAAGRVTSSDQRSVQYGYLSGSTYVYGLTDIKNLTFYDADGNVRETTDGNGNATYFYYDADGHKTAEVDPAGYLTTYQVDGQGNVLTETQYAHAASSYSWNGYTAPTSSGDDRISTFTYDRNGRQLTQSRLNVQASTVSATGALTTASANDTITYTYDALGDVLSKTQATGDATQYRYDSAGRQVHSQETSYTDYRGVTVTPATDTVYNRLGQVVQSIVRGDGTTSAPDRVTTTAYGAGGRVISVTDPTGFTRTDSYDAQGNLVAQQYGRQLSSGGVEIDSSFITYDGRNREVSSEIGTWNGSSWTYGATTDQFYDAYGEVVAQGTNTGGVQANAQKYADYDNAGRVWRTNMSDGVSRAYAYDSNGNATILFQTTGSVDLRSMTDLSTVFAAENANPNSVTETITAYDVRNLVTDTIQPTSNQSYNPIHALEVDTTAQGTRYFFGNVAPNSAAGRVTQNPGYGASQVGAAAYVGGSGGSISISSSITYMQFMGIEYNQFGYPIAQVYSYSDGLTINLNGALNGGGTIRVLNGSGSEIAEFNPPSSGVTVTTSSGEITDSSIAYANEYDGWVTVMQDMPWGQKNLGSVYVSRESTASIALSHTLYLDGVSPAASTVMGFVRSSSTGQYTMVGLTQDASGFWHVDMGQPPFSNQAGGSWELRYMAFDGSGHIVDSVDGTLSTDGNGAPSYSQNADYVNGPGQSFVVNYSGHVYLVFTGMPSGTASITIHYGTSPNFTSVSGNGSGAWGEPGLFAWDITNMGPVQFWVQPMDGAGHMIGNQYSYGQFGDGGSQSSWWQLEPGWAADRRFQLSPPAGATQQRFRYQLSSGAWSAWMTPDANNMVDLSGLTDFFGQANAIYEYQTYSGSQLLSDTYGNLSVGYNGQSASVTSQAVSVTAKVQFSPQSGAHTIKVYYRTKGSTGAFTEATITADANGNFLWDADAAGIRPASGVNNLEYYYDAFASNGSLMPPVNGDDHVHGYLAIQSDHYQATNDYSIQWVADLSQSSQFIVDRKQTWNAFGEVASETDGRGDVTNLAYNTLGKLTTKTNPQVTWYDESGAAHTSSPVETYYYDVSGRQVGARDANGNLTTLALLTDSGYGGQAAQTVTEFNADGTETEMGFDALGEARIDTTAFGTALAATTTDTYDGDGNLIEVDHPQRSGGNTPGVQLKDYYAYDGLGERIRHTDSVYGSGVVESTDYDTAGRVTQTTDLAGLQTTYAYSWIGGLVTTGLATYGGWQKITTNSAGLSANEKDDVFGHEVSSQDFGGHTYTYAYNYAGELTQQTNSAGQNITYAYYTNGYIASMTDNALGMKSTYDYDNDGNRTVETYASTAASPVYYENSVVTYDAMNRITEIKDPKADIQYKYDAQGNRREVLSTYTDGVGNTTATEDYWYKYDSMNRFVLTMGTLSGGVISAGSTGVSITYDAAGNRHSATYGADGHTETYSYSADGYLENTTIGSVQVATRINDALGRVTSYTQVNTDGSFNSSRAGITYDRDNRITDETDTTGSTVSTIHNDYRAWNGSAYAGADQGVITHSSSTTSGTTTNTNYYYQWWDQAKQQTALINPSSPGAGSGGSAAQGFSQITYDVNGHIKQMVDVAGNRVLNYEDDANGQVLVREEWDAGVLGPRQQNYFFNGHQVGDVSNNGPSASQMDYAQELAQTDPSTAGKGGFRNGKPVSSADFDQNYQPINSGYPGMAAQTYTVKSGDSLRSIASMVWGDANLWYLIADANGITLSTALVAGQILTIPNKVANFHNTSSTFKPYNPGEAIGDTLPTMAPEPVSMDILQDHAANWGGADFMTLGQGAVGSSNATVTSSLFGDAYVANQNPYSQINWNAVAAAGVPADQIQNLQAAAQAEVDAQQYQQIMSGIAGDMGSALFMQQLEGEPLGVSSSLMGLQAWEGDSPGSRLNGPLLSPALSNAAIGEEMQNGFLSLGDALAQMQLDANARMATAQALQNPLNSIANMNVTASLPPIGDALASMSNSWLSGSGLDAGNGEGAQTQLAGGTGNQTSNPTVAQSYSDSPGDYGGVGNGFIGVPGIDDSAAGNGFETLLDGNAGLTPPGFDGTSASGFGFENLSGPVASPAATSAARSTSVATYSDPLSILASPFGDGQIKSLFGPATGSGQSTPIGSSQLASTYVQADGRTPLVGQPGPFNQPYEWVETSTSTKLVSVPMASAGQGLTPWQSVGKTYNENILGPSLMLGAVGGAGEGVPVEPGTSTGSSYLNETQYWPKNDGFLVSQNQTLYGGLYGRFGNESGNYLAPVGTAPETLSLRPGTTSQPYTVYQVVKPLPAAVGPASPWFAQPGLGTQVMLPMSVNEAVNQGYLARH